MPFSIIAPEPLLKIVPSQVAVLSLTLVIEPVTTIGIFSSFLHELKIGINHENTTINNEVLKKYFIVLTF